jgi:hypothetical protein
MISAADMHVVGWPDPASDVDRTESMRSCVAMLWRTSSDGDDMKFAGKFTVPMRAASLDDHPKEL